MSVRTILNSPVSPSVFTCRPYVDNVGYLLVLRYDNATHPLTTATPLLTAIAEMRLRQCHGRGRNAISLKSQQKMALFRAYLYSH